MKFQILNFKGKNSKFAEQLLPTSYAITANNTNIFYGDLRPILKNKLVKRIYGYDIIKTLYKYDSSFLFFDSDVDIARSPIQGNIYNRIYFTENGILKGTDKSLIQSDIYYKIAIESPTSPITVSVDGSGDGFVIESRTYIYTYVRVWPDGKEDESAPSPASSVVDLQNGQYCVLSGFLIPQDKDETGISKIRIYRSNTTSYGSIWQFVDEIPLTQTSYTDTKESSELGEELTTENYTPPPETLFGICNHPNGFLVGFSKNEICFSEILQPHAWPESYRLVFNDNIVAVGVTTFGVVVSTETELFLCVGSSPSTMSVEKIDATSPCLWKRGFVVYKNMVVYPSWKGLILVSGGIVKNVLEDILSPNDWYQYIQDDFLGCIYEDKYFGFSPSKSFVFDLKNGNFVDLDFRAYAYHIDKYDNKLNFITKDNYSFLLEEYAKTSCPLIAKWKSGQIKDRDLSNISAARVFIDVPIFNCKTLKIIENIVYSKNDEYSSLLAEVQNNTIDFTDTISQKFLSALQDGELGELNTYEVNKYSIDGGKVVDNLPVYDVSLLFDCGEINGTYINNTSINLNCYDDFYFWGITGYDRNTIFRLYVDGELKHEHGVLSSRGFRLPQGYKGRWIEVEIETKQRVKGVEIASSIKELT